MTGIRGPDCGWRSRVASSWALPSCVIAVVFPVPAGPDTTRPRRADSCARLSTTSLRPLSVTCETVGVATTASRL